MKTAVITGLCLVAALCTATGCSSTPHVTAADTSCGQANALRVGVFDSRGVALAYGRSTRPDCFLAKVDDVRRRHARAERAGDEQRMVALENEAQALQRHIHEQVFSGTPIDEALALIDDDLPGVAERAEVALIAAGVLHHDPCVELVDVTTHMCALFDPDEGTQEAIRELLARRPVPLSELSHDH